MDGMQDQTYEIGVKHHDAYRETGDMADLETAIQHIQNAVDMTPESHPDRTNRLLSLGYAYGDRHARTCITSDLELSIQLVEESLEGSKDGRRAARFQYLGLGYYNKYKLSDSISDLGMAIQRFQEALDATPENHPARAMHLEALAFKSREKHQTFGDRLALEGSARLLQEAINLTAHHHPDWSRRLESLGIIHRELYRETGNISDLHIAIQRCQQSVDATPKESPYRAHRLENLCIAYRDRYQSLGTVSDLETVILRSQESLDITTDQDPSRARRLEILGSGYNDRYLRTGVLSDLEASITMIEQALRITPENAFRRVNLLQACGLVYQSKYQRTGAISDLKMAAQWCQLGLDEMPKHHNARAELLAALGGINHEKYLTTGEISKLEISIQQFQEAFELTPECHPDRKRLVESLGVVHHSKYQRTGAISELDIAVQKFHEALRIPPNNPVLTANLFAFLGAAYHNRYGRTGAVFDLDTGIEYVQKSLNLASDNHPLKAKKLHSLGIGYYNRYKCKNMMLDLETAIQSTEDALSIIPNNHPDQNTFLRTLGRCYHRKFQTTDAIKDLETAIKLYQEAVDTTPKWMQLELATRIASLGYGYHSRYGKLKEMGDLDTAIKCYYEALDKTPESHPEIGARVRSLGDAYYLKFRETRALSDLEAALQHLEKGLAQSNSSAIEQLLGGKLLLNLQIETQQWQLAYETAFKSLSLVPLLCSRSLKNSDKQNVLLDIAGLASDAAAVALMAGKSTYDTISLLELGRGIITGSLTDLRGEVPELQHEHPQIASEYVKLRDELNNPKISSVQVDGSPITEESALLDDQRYNLGQKLEQTIQNIRRLHGFDRFLMGLTENDLKTAAAFGPIVIINVSNCRCDALIIKKAGFMTLPLPKLQRKEVQARAKVLRTLDNLDTEILEWLWDTIVEPILGTLGFHKVAEGSWPRIWWVPTGPLTKFPIHAAGYHYQKSPDTALDRVISSYSTSARALAQTYRSRLDGSEAQRPMKVILIGMETTPGQKDLPFTSEEIKKLVHICSSMSLTTMNPPSCRKDVVSALENCDVFHFAGHGRTNPLDPLGSSLLLNGDELAVASFLEMNSHTRMPFLAYLSACGTGQVKHDDLIDEGLHLIGACQSAGFRHVIGTLLEVNDQSCVDAAATTYKWMVNQGFSDISVSEGLHRACRKLREIWTSDNMLRQSKAAVGVPDIRESKRNVGARAPRAAEPYDDEPLYWVPYVHFGS